MNLIRAIFRELRTPDDFAGRPYVGGANQGLHAVLGAALVGVPLYAGASLFWAVLCGLGGALAWEAWQYLRRGALRPDYWRDLAYWASGGVAMGLAYNAGVITGTGLLSPLVPIAAFIIEFARITWKKR